MKKFRTRLELASLMGISYPTFYRRVKEKGLNVSKGLISPKEQSEIFNHLGCIDLHDHLEKLGGEFDRL